MTGPGIGRGAGRAALAAAGAAIALLATPVGLLETLVASSGLSEVLTAAAPPLGLTARLSMAGFAALLAVGLVGILRRDPPGADEDMKVEGRGSRVQGARKMGFAFSKLTALARGRALPDSKPDAPSLRRADAHPDAPPRPPIFASRDFDGVEIFARQGGGRRPLVAHPESGSDSIQPVPGFAMPRAPLPPVEEAIADDIASAQPVADGRAVVPEPIAADIFAAPVGMMPAERLAPLPLPTHGLSIAQLTDRLERGLALRRRSPSTRPTQVLADMPVAPPVPVRDSVAPDADEALRAALGALRSMAGTRAR